MNRKQIKMVSLLFLAIFTFSIFLMATRNSVTAQTEIFSFNDTGQRFGVIPDDVASIAVGDMNNDGYPDIVVASNESSTIIQLYLNDGYGNFKKTNDTFPVVSNPNGLWNFGIVLRDFNKDGWLDIATADAWRGVNIYLNSPNGTFSWTQHILIPEVNEVKGIDAADINGDGFDDLVIGGHNGIPDHLDRIYLNDGTGLFVDSGQRIGNDLTWLTRFGDFNNDGFPDYVSIYRYREHTAKIHVNDGHGNFTQTFDLPTTQNDDSFDVKIADLNNDGLMDVVVANSYDSTSNTTSKIFLNKGNFNFQVSDDQLGEPNCETKGISLIDINIDGYYDILLGNWNYENDIYLNDGTGHFSKSTVSIPSYQTASVACADFNSDGFVDVVVGNAADGHYRVYLNNGIGLHKSSLPSSPTMLTTNIVGSTCHFSWEEPKNTIHQNTENQNSLTGYTYNIRISNASGQNNVVSGMSGTGTGHLGSALSYSVQGLPAGVYYWSVQTVGLSFQKSAWSEEKQFTVVSLAETPDSSSTSQPPETPIFAIFTILTAVVAVGVLLTIFLKKYPKAKLTLARHNS